MFCGTNKACIDDRRVRVVRRFIETVSGYRWFCFRFYQGSQGVQPTYKQFMTDRRQVTGRSLERKRRLLLNVGQARSFSQNTRQTMTKSEFVKRCC